MDYGIHMQCIFTKFMLTGPFQSHYKFALTAHFCISMIFLDNYKSALLVHFCINMVILCYFAIPLHQQLLFSLG